jgi:hypothetical protein
MASAAMPSMVVGTSPELQTPKACDGLVEQVAHFIVSANIRLDEGGSGTQTAQLGFESLALCFPAAGNDGPGTVLGERQSGGATDACEGPHDQNGRLIHGATPADRLMHRTPSITEGYLLTALTPCRDSRLV